MNESSHFYKVYNTFKLIFCTDWQLNRNCICMQSMFHLLNAAVEVCTSCVHFIYIAHSWYIIFICLSPNSFRLRLNSTFSAKYCNRSVKNSKRSLNFYSKVNVTWCINDIDSVIFPETSCRSRSNCNTSFLLLSHPVHSCCTFVNFTNLVSLTCIEQYSLSCCCFTSINVSHYSNISSHF